MILRLETPEVKHEAEWYAYRREFVEAGDSMDGCGPMRRTDDYDAYLRDAERYTRPDTLPEGYVLATQFFCLDENDRIVGMIQVRHYLNEHLLQFGGHIGYSVRPSERRKGYAKQMLALALDYCRDTVHLDRALVTCDDDNEGSRRTILANGGVYENTVVEDGQPVERYWIAL